MFRFRHRPSSAKPSGIGVQERLKENKSRRGGHPGRVRLLSGRIFCAVCGKPMNIRNPGNAPKEDAERYSAYVCGQHQHKRQFCGVKV